MRQPRTVVGAWLACALVALPGCSMAKRGVHARDFWPRGAAWKQAAVDALKDPGTWGPAAGAVAIGIGDWDGKISDWAVENTPLFGSPAHATEASNNLRTASHLGMLATALAVPPGDGPWQTRPERLVLEHLAAIASTSVTGGLKEAVGRERPNEANDQSFPSGHSTRAFAYNAQSGRNLSQLGLPKPARLALRTSLTAFAAGTAWARVEAGVHFPTDVLAGAALGNFVSLLIHDACLDANPAVQAGVQIDGRTTAVWLSLSF